MPVSMTSDGHSTGWPLIKQSCACCGLAQHAVALSGADLKRIFASGYALNSKPPNQYDAARARQYAEWIAAQVEGWAPSSIYEIGCGNGAMLTELACRFPHARVSGIEPSPTAAELARAQGFAVDIGFFPEDECAHKRYQLIVAVNVIEHTPDPLAFLQAVKRRLAPDGRLILIFPDGDRPSTELLILDHLHSFTKCAIQQLVHRAGLGWVDLAQAHGASGFQILTATHNADPQAPTLPSDSLHEERRQFLAHWQELDEHLSHFLGERADLILFGVGEFSSLLHAYAPCTWRKLRAVTADLADHSAFHGLSCIPPRGLPPQATLLIGTRLEVQAQIAQRFHAQGLATVYLTHDYELQCLGVA